MIRKWMLVVFSSALLLACADDFVPSEGELDDAEVAEFADADQTERVASEDTQVSGRSDALIYGDDAPGPVGCRVDCMDVCNQDGKHYAACQTSCGKACHGTYVPPASSGGGQNQICLAGNKAWQAICNITPPLQAACLFSGGCSGCRKKMDKNC